MTESGSASFLGGIFRSGSVCEMAVSKMLALGSSGTTAGPRSPPARIFSRESSINPLSGGEPDTPAHWSVTFGVDEADATAAKATELGGTVVVPPFDAPWVRMTVLTDPQGATFIANQFVPENSELAG